MEALLVNLNILPFPLLGSSVHISLTPSSTMLQCLSKALTRPSSFLLFLKYQIFIANNSPVVVSSLWLYLQLMRTWVLFLTESVRTLSGPVWNSSCSFCSLCSGVISCLLPILIVILCYSADAKYFWSTQTFSWVSRLAMAPGRESFSNPVLCCCTTLACRGRRLEAGTDKNTRTYLHFTPLVKVLYAIYFTYYIVLTTDWKWWKFNENEINNRC